MIFARQLFLLLWKNWTLQRRKLCVSIFEILIPVFFAGLFLALRNLIEYDAVREPTRFEIEDTNTMSNVDFIEGMVGFAPNNPATIKVMAIAEALLQNQTSSKAEIFKGFPTEQEALDYFKVHSNEMHKIIVFYNVDNTSTSLPKNIKLGVRPEDSHWLTRLTFPLFQFGGPRDKYQVQAPYYKSRGILRIQSLMGEALIKHTLEENGQDPNSVSLGVYSQKLPFPPYVIDPIIGILQTLLPSALMWSFIICVIVNTKTLVYEKERKLKESMKLMGLLPSVYWTSWFITFLIYLVPVLIIYTILLGVDLTSKGAVLNASNPFLFFLFLLCYGVALITYCFMISTFVQKANVGAVLSGILFLAFDVPYSVADNRYQDLRKSEKLGTCLFFNSALSFGAKVIGIYEGTGEGVQFHNFYKPGTVDDNLSLSDCMLMLLVDSGIHLIITWYLDNVRPGEFGVPKPLYFPFMKSYWCGTGEKAYGSIDNAQASQGGRFEKDPSNLKAGIQIKDLTKVFGKKMAVAGMSLNMYEGQISVLLGHNGAGKTTTMSMLTGFIPATSGSAIVNGYDIRKNIEGVRSSLGLCPQHNVLFDNLTVREHLHFFAELKGTSKSDVKEEIESLISELELKNKIDDFSSKLSGGQKRKLSVAIALIGGSKVVVLDEPSSGMDPAARRQTWTLLQKHRQGRTMLLTTHYMDEADVLGDRIAIMAEGVVKCCGTSMFLKKLYGAGYHLVLVKDPSCDVDVLTEVIQSHVKTSALEGVVNMEITYLLPQHESTSFPILFEELEAKKESLGINSFGISATTMEEVFLKVGENAYHHDELQPNADDNGDDSDKGKDYVRVNTEPMPTGQDLVAFNKGFLKKTALPLILAKIKALFVKKALLSWRNRLITLAQLLLPLLFTILGLSIDSRKSESSKSPELIFDLSPFGKTIIPYTANDTGDNKLINLYGQQFGGLHTLEEFNSTKYGGYDNYSVKRAEELGTATYNKRMIIGLEAIVPKPGQSLAAIAHFNGQPFHSQPISINMMMNAFVQYYLGKTYSFQTSINPLPKDEVDDVEYDLVKSYSGMTFGIFIGFGMAFLTNLFIYFIVKERQIGAKHMQIVSGISPLTYWIPTFLWDFICYMLSGFLILIAFVAYSKDEFIGDGRWLLIILVLALYGWAVLPFTYTFHFLFKSPPTGVVVAILLSIISGLFTLITVIVLKTPGLDTKDEADIMDWIFMVIFPNYNMAQSFVNIYANYVALQSCLPRQAFCNQPDFMSPCCRNHCDRGEFHFCMSFHEDYTAWEKPGIGSYLLFMFLEGFIFSFMVLLVEYNVFSRIIYQLKNLSNSGNRKPLTDESSASMLEDSDVAAERERINSTPASELSSTDPLLLVNLFKRYGKFIAVDQICLGVPEQECFGLLGQNGAGKTTTFKMLTGDVMLTGGNAYLKGYDVRNSIKDVQANMGYCPQFDALLDQMTGRETLTMYARLRGIPEANIKQVVNELLDTLLLKPHSDKLAGNYSGGNKRKLSTAIALVGDPPFIMLDEPSAGMDPKARRQLWDVLSQVRASGRTLVLTSHSMEECDALCTRIAIMVNGSFVCLGSPQHLKNKFGQGYTLMVQVGVREDGGSGPVDPVINFVTQNFPGSKVFYNHQGYVDIQVPDTNISLARVFSLMESAKVNGDLYVQDYSVHQTTLEQVFLTFTRVQNIPKEAKRGLCARICC